MDSKPSYWRSVQLFQIYIRNVHWIESLTSSWMNQVCREENMSRAASQVNTSVDRWQSDFLLIEMTTICFGVKLRKKENQKSDLSVQHFFWNIHRVIASWIFEWWWRKFFSQTPLIANLKWYLENLYTLEKLFLY